MKHNGQQIDAINHAFANGLISYEDAILRLAPIADRLSRRDRFGKRYSPERLLKATARG